MDRRTLMLSAAATAATAAGPAAVAQTSVVPMIDTTSHLYDPKRPISTFYRPDGPGLRAHELRARAPSGVVGAVVIESSPWLEDNLWLLEEAEDEPFIVGVVGNLKPDDKDFAAQVERYNRAPLYQGIRHGNIWPGYDLPEQMKSPDFMAGLKLLAQADLVLDLANPRLNLMQAALRINDAVPELRVIVDHFGAYRPKSDEWAALEPILREFAQRPNIYGKLTGLTREKPDEPATVTADANRQRLDRFYAAFGEDRIMGGSFAAANVAMYAEYMKGKPREIAEKFFWRNSARVYKWAPRTPHQPRLNG